MWNPKLLSRVLLTAAIILSASQTQAHRLKTVLTTIELNSHTGMLEVIHRSYAHDVEHTLGSSLRDVGGLESIEGQARAAIELTRHFNLWGEANEEIILELVGAELENEFFYIYQEAPMTVLPEPFQIGHNMLMDYWPDMTNSVNIQFEGEIKTLIFSNSTGPQSISASRKKE